MKRFVIIAGLSLGALCACAQIAAFEQRAAPVIARGCADFHAAEASPLVQVALAAGNVASGGIVGSIKSFGDAFCSVGPPASDTTTPEQQAQWLSGIAAQLVAAAAGK